PSLDYEPWTPRRTSTLRLASTTSPRYPRFPRSYPTSASSPYRSAPSSSNSREHPSHLTVRVAPTRSRQLETLNPLPLLAADWWLCCSAPQTDSGSDSDWN